MSNFIVFNTYKEYILYYINVVYLYNVQLHIYVQEKMSFLFLKAVINREREDRFFSINVLVSIIRQAKKRENFLLIKMSAYLTISENEVLSNKTK